MILLTLVVVLVGLIYAYNKHKHSYWKNKGVVGPKPTPFMGHIGEELFMKKHAVAIYDEIYKNYEDEAYVGIYLQYQPAILVRDPELVKTVLIKDFQSFHDNAFDFDEAVDPIFSMTPFAAKGERWKRSRNQMTPAFTGGKMKSMFHQMAIICDRLKSYIESSKDATSQDGILVNDLSTKLLTEVIALTAFGLEAEVFTNPKSQFKQKLQNLFLFGGLNILKVAINNTFPFLKSFNKIGFFNREASDWLSNIVSETVKYREANNVQRDDFLNHMIQLKKKEDYEFTDKEMAASSITFVAAGIDSSSLTLAYALYEVAANPDIQNRLRTEVNTVLAKYNGELCYEAVMQMLYLDQVVQETLRKYPGFMFMFKYCTEVTTLPRKDGSDGVLIQPGTTILLPIYSIQRDPAYYPNPDKFDPERFTEEEKQKRTKDTFLVFGAGPRHCIGMPFAVAVIKAAVANTVANFNLKVTSKTIEPLQHDESSVLFAPKGGIWLNMEKIK